MKLIVPVKSNSTRVPNKNFREFFDGKSLAAILLEKLLFKGAENIYLSCDDPSKKEVADQYGCNFILRDKRLCDNDTPLTEVINGVVNQLPADNDDIAWCQVIDPMFDDYKYAFSKWEDIKSDHDSLVVIYPTKKYFLTSNGIPINFGFGNWHIKSQNLPPVYELTFTLSIFTRETVDRCKYYVGTKPFWFESSNIHLDIDTIEEFEIAGIMYGKNK